MAKKPRARHPAEPSGDAFSPDTIEKFFDYGLHVPTRTIYMGSVQAFEDGGESGVDAKLAEQVIKAVHLLERKSAQTTITLIVNNPGGDIVHGLAIYDALCGSSCPITIRVFGRAMSMGSVILQAGNRRILSPNAALLIHNGSAAMAGTFEQCTLWMREWERSIRNNTSILLKRIQEKNPNFTEEEFQELMGKDTFLSAEEALALGLADEIRE